MNLLIDFRKIILKTQSTYTVQFQAKFLKILIYKIKVIESIIAPLRELKLYLPDENVNRLRQTDLYRFRMDFVFVDRLFHG